jgi:preprotein translocase subunit SecA
MQGAAAELAALDDAALVTRLRAVAPQAIAPGADAPLHQALLLVAEAARRALGLRPFPTQLVGAATLVRGRLAEMQTGEGKTLTAGLAACLVACAGVPVHVVTVNDYLAERDAQTMGPLFAFAGLRVGSVVHGRDQADKRAAYACEVAYCTGKEMVFDYLRDRVAAGARASVAQLSARQLWGAMASAPVLRGLHFAIVDEADSILIDEARTPLILAVKAGAFEHAPHMPQALQWAAELQAGQDYVLDAGRRQISLTAAGCARLAQRARGVGDAHGGGPDGHDGQGRQTEKDEKEKDEKGPWQAAHAREHLVAQALRALHLFERDRHYLVDAEGAVQIIDEYTGRVLPGRTWEQGLHQMIECKEGMDLSERTKTLARITYQRFFARYLRLAGMTGTAREMARELAVVYRLDTVSIPTHKPSARRYRSDTVCPTAAEKWLTVVQQVARLQARGQPVLVGTRSVQASEALSQQLRQHGLVHQVLNARQDADEAAVVAAAGQRGAITVATNMAGRGTDIALGEGVAELGGLCVLLTEYHESPRIDRQLLGRCARQGQPGECLAVVALDDDLFVQHGGAALGWLRRLSRPPGFAVTRVRRAAQARAEAMHARTRRDATQRDRQLEQSMGFSGDPL